MNLMDITNNKNHLLLKNCNNNNYKNKILLHLEKIVKKETQICNFRTSKTLII